MKLIKVVHTLLTILTIFFASIFLLNWERLRVFIGLDEPRSYYHRDLAWENFSLVLLTLPFLICFLVLFQLNIAGVWTKISRYTNTTLIAILTLTFVEVLIETSKWSTPGLKIIYLPSLGFLLITTFVLRKTLS